MRIQTYISSLAQKLYYCQYSGDGRHKWVEHMYLEKLHAWYDYCVCCGRQKIHQTTGNTMILNSKLEIELVIAQNGDFLDPKEIRKILFYEAEEYYCYC